MTTDGELFKRHPANPLLTAASWPYAVNTVFNAAATTVGSDTVLLVRVEDRRGISHLTVARSSDGVSGWRIEPRAALRPEPESHPEEIWGIEDPRVSWLPEREAYAIAYTAYSRAGPLVSLACTADFKGFQRLGAILPPEDKDAALFPCRFQGRWAVLHRPASTFPGAGAHIWISFSPDLKHWGDHQVLVSARRGAWWDANRIGLGPPPLQTREGWLIVYHGVRRTASGSLYRLGLALLDLEDPRVVRRRSAEWVFGPRESYERSGDVGDVVFPCGWTMEPSTGEVKLYYGAADTSIALATAQLEELLAYMLSCPEGPGRID